MHLADSRNERCERSNNWDKPSDNNSFTAMLFVKILCCGNILSSKEERVGPFEYFWSKFSTKCIPYTISDNRRNTKNDNKKVDVDRDKSRLDEEPCGKKETVARKEEADEEA